MARDDCGSAVKPKRVAGSYPLPSTKSCVDIDCVTTALIQVETVDATGYAASVAWHLMNPDGTAGAVYTGALDFVPCSVNRVKVVDSCDDALAPPTPPVDGALCDGTLVPIVVSNTVRTVPHPNFVQKVQLCEPQKDYEVERACNAAGEPVLVQYDAGVVPPTELSRTNMLTGLAEPAGTLRKCDSDEIEIVPLVACLNGVEITGISIVADATTPVITGELWRDQVTGLWGPLPAGAVVGKCCEPQKIVDAVHGCYEIAPNTVTTTPIAAEIVVAQAAEVAALDATLSTLINSFPAVGSFSGGNWVEPADTVAVNTLRVVSMVPPDFSGYIPACATIINIASRVTLVQTNIGGIFTVGTDGRIGTFLGGAFTTVDTLLGGIAAGASRTMVYNVTVPSGGSVVVGMQTTEGSTNPSGPRMTYTVTAQWQVTWNDTACPPTIGCAEFQRITTFNCDGTSTTQYWKDDADYTPISTDIKSGPCPENKIAVEVVGYNAPAGCRAIEIVKTISGCSGTIIKVDGYEMSGEAIPDFDATRVIAKCPAAQKLVLNSVHWAGPAANPAVTYSAFSFDNYPDISVDFPSTTSVADLYIHGIEHGPTQVWGTNGQALVNPTTPIPWANAQSAVDAFLAAVGIAAGSILVGNDGAGQPIIWFDTSVITQNDVAWWLGTSTPDNYTNKLRARNPQTFTAPSASGSCIEGKAWYSDITGELVKVTTLDGVVVTVDATTLKEGACPEVCEIAAPVGVVGSWG
jgi:hypothetical protein